MPVVFLGHSSEGPRGGIDQTEEGGEILLITRAGLPPQPRGHLGPERAGQGRAKGAGRQGRLTL